MTEKKVFTMNNKQLLKKFVTPSTPLVADAYRRLNIPLQLASAIDSRGINYNSQSGRPLTHQLDENSVLICLLLTMRI